MSECYISKGNYMVLQNNLVRMSSVVHQHGLLFTVSSKHRCKIWKKEEKRESDGTHWSARMGEKVEKEKRGN